jgi:hypothetical protein
MSFWPEEYDAGASTLALKGGEVGGEHINQRIYGADLDYTKESAPFLI